MSRVPPPGDSFNSELPPTLLPHLEHIYRFTADLSADTLDGPNMRGSGQTISAANFSRAIVAGQRVNGKVLENSGADLATRVASDMTKVYMLESSYTIQTDDGIPIVVDAKGLFILDPSVTHAEAEKPESSQHKHQSYSRLTYSAPSNSDYRWINNIVALGLMTIWDGKVVNDAYRLDAISLEEARDLIAPPQDESSEGRQE